MNKLIETLTSRKLWATIAGIATVASTKGFKEGMWEIVALIAAYVASLGVQDAAKAIAAMRSATQPGDSNKS